MLLDGSGSCLWGVFRWACSRLSVQYWHPGMDPKDRPSPSQVIAVQGQLWRSITWAYYCPHFSQVACFFQCVFCPLSLICSLICLIYTTMDSSRSDSSILPCLYNSHALSYIWLPRMTVLLSSQVKLGTRGRQGFLRVVTVGQALFKGMGTSAYARKRGALTWGWDLGQLCWRPGHSRFGSIRELSLEGSTNCLTCVSPPVLQRNLGLIFVRTTWLYHCWSPDVVL